MDDETEFSDRDWFSKQWKERSVPLSAAVLWIATNGVIETEHVIATREAISRAQHILITSLSDGNITASGHPEGKVSETTDVPQRSFDCEFLPIGEPLPLSDVFDDDSDPTLRWGALGEIDWRHGGGRGDTIENCHFVIWTRLSVKKSDVLNRWPRARRGDLIAEWDRDHHQKSSDVERYRVKGSFDAKWWTLDQVAVWAMSRSRDLVEIGGEHPEHGMISTLDIHVSIHQVTEKQNGRDINAELWSASGLSRTGYRFDIPSYLTSLLEQGRLHAFGREPRETAARPLSPFDWAGLKIGCSGDTDRLGVWRREQPTRGKGDVLHVRVNRDDVLREFPEHRSATRANIPQPATQERKTKVKEIAAWLMEKYPNRTSRKAKELKEEIKRTRPDIGDFSDKTLQNAKTLAYPKRETQ